MFDFLRLFPVWLAEIYQPPFILIHMVDEHSSQFDQEFSHRGDLFKAPKTENFQQT
jgi:hypothetical protein